MGEEKQTQLEELMDELEIIFSVKDSISKEEIDNFIDKFNLLSEYDIRKKIAEITGEDTYISNLENEKEVTLPSRLENDKNEEIKEIEYDNSKDNINGECKNVGEIEKEDLHKSVVEVVGGEKYSFNENTIPEVLFIRGETKYGQLSIEWGWPDEIKEVFICHRMDKFPTGPKDSSSTQCEVKRCGDDKVGSYTINKAGQGDFYFCVYTKVRLNGKVFYSQGQKRLVVNKEPLQIFYEIKIRRNIFGKLKSAQILVWSKEKEISLPQLTLIGKLGNMPLQKSDGESVINIDYEVLTKDKCIDIDLPSDKIRGNMYVKLFFQDDANSRLFRIVSPAKEELYFK